MTSSSLEEYKKKVEDLMKELERKNKIINNLARYEVDVSYLRIMEQVKKTLTWSYYCAKNSQSIRISNFAKGTWKLMFLNPCKNVITSTNNFSLIANAWHFNIVLGDAWYFKIINKHESQNCCFIGSEFEHLCKHYEVSCWIGPISFQWLQDKTLVIKFQKKNYTHIEW